MSDSKSAKSHKHGITGYFWSAFEEFGKVTWPTKEQAALLTAVVLGVSLATTVFLGLLDLGFSEAYKWVLTQLSS